MAYTFPSPGIHEAARVYGMPECLEAWSLVEGSDSVSSSATQRPEACSAGWRKALQGESCPADAHADQAPGRKRKAQKRGRALKHYPWVGNDCHRSSKRSGLLQNLHHKRYSACAHEGGLAFITTAAPRRLPRTVPPLDQERQGLAQCSCLVMPLVTSGGWDSFSPRRWAQGDHRSLGELSRTTDLL